jgi:hypothetical protein
VIKQAIMTGTDVMALPSGSAVVLHATDNGALVRRPWSAQIVIRCGIDNKRTELLGTANTRDVVHPAWRYRLLYRRDWDSR